MNEGKSKRKKPKRNHLLQAANHCTKAQRTQKMVENCYKAQRNKHTPDYIGDGSQNEKLPGSKASRLKRVTEIKPRKTSY